MGGNWDVGICNEKAGFLFSHACASPPAGSCQSCGKPICANHVREVEGGIACIECSRHHAHPHHHRSSYYDPYYYGGYHYDGYNDYSGDHWGSDTFQQRTHQEQDVNDFTEADSESLIESEDVEEEIEDGEFESDMSES